MNMTIENLFVFGLVALVILIKIGLLVLGLLLIGKWLFGRRATVAESARDNGCAEFREK
ncbi:MAG: hypothetical protein PVG22_18250 [Chromatiales bacterium]|jgi:hypothetical protein